MFSAITDIITFKRAQVVDFKTPISDLKYQEKDESIPITMII